MFDARSSKDWPDAIVNQPVRRHPDRRLLVTIIIALSDQQLRRSVQNHPAWRHDRPQQQSGIVIIIPIERAPLTSFHPPPSPLNFTVDRPRDRATVGRPIGQADFKQLPAPHVQYRPGSW